MTDKTPTLKTYNHEVIPNVGMCIVKVLIRGRDLNMEGVKYAEILICRGRRLYVEKEGCIYRER